MLGLLLAAALAPATPAEPPSELDDKDLRKAITQAIEQRDTASLAGRRFRIVLPFASQKSRRYASLKQSARWSYDGRRDLLTTSIGLGEITARNFSSFQSSGLEELPPLQSLVFSVSAGEGGILLARDARPGEDAYESGRQARSVSFGLAVPFSEADRSGLPRGFTPLQVNQVRATRLLAVNLARSMSLVVEGEIVDLGKAPSVFCGDYKGQIHAKDANEDTTIVISDRQCFATARIDRVKVVNDRGVLSAWPSRAD